MQLSRVTSRIINGVARRYRPLRWRMDRNTRSAYLRGGRVPMSPGYEAYKEELIAKVLDDEQLLHRFREGRRLPERYGVGIDERCVEYPWLFSRLKSQPLMMLDAGSVLNHAFILDRPPITNKKLHILTFAPEHAAFWQRGISYIYDDLRAMPMQSRLYDEVVCLSTLEHVGMDASFYTGTELHKEQSPADFADALREIRRVLKPGGTLYLSVPFGVYRNIGVLQVFDEPMLRKAIQLFGPAEADVSYYLYTASGWNIATAMECAASEYVSAYFRYYMTPEAERPARLPREHDLAAAARAVACVAMTVGAA